MSNIDILERKSVNLASLKEELDSIKKRDTELSFRGQKTEEYVNEFHLLKPKQADELYEKIEKLGVPRLKDTHINKIIDMMPKGLPELKVIIQGYAVPVTNENLKKIIELVSEYGGEK
jgi:DNA-directed RNA polymerase subunit F